MNLLILIAIGLVALFLVGIFLSARHAARLGERYIGSDDPVERYKEKVEDNQAGRWWTWRE